MHASFFETFEKYKNLFKKGCVLHFSTGKDAVCTLHILVKKYGIHPKLIYWNLHPFLLTMHKNPLEYYSHLYETTYQVIAHHDVICDIANKINKKAPSLKEWLLKLYYDHGELPQVFGNKDSDGLITKMICNKGARESLHRFYPLWQWKDDHVFRYLNAEKVSLSQSYANGFRDINEFNEPETLIYLKQKYLKDYNKLIELEPWRLSIAE